MTLVIPSDPAGPGGGGGASFDLKDADLSGQVDGIETVFIVPEAYNSGTLSVYRSGQKGLRGTTYTETNPALGIFTMVPILLVGEELEVTYQV